MKIIVQNQAKIPNKYIRLIKWKLYRMNKKFSHLLYAEVNIKAEGNAPITYQSNIRLGIRGYDLILKNSDNDLNTLFYKSFKGIHRYLSIAKREA